MKPPCHTSPGRGATNIPLQGYLAHQKTPTPLESLGIGLRQGPREVRFLMSEVPLYRGYSDKRSTSLQWAYAYEPMIKLRAVGGLTFEKPLSCVKSL